MINEGLIITGLGMSWVFLFLGVLVLAMMIMSKVMQKYFPDKETAENKPSSEKPAAHAGVIGILKARGLLP